MKFYLIKTIFKKLIIMTPALLIIFTSPSWALNGLSHQAINEYIAENTFTFEPGKVFSLNDYLKEQLGIQKGVETSFNYKQIFEWIKDAGTSEDNSYRYLNHFYNPLTKQGYSYGPINLFISLFGYSPMPSLNWVLMPTGTQNMDGSGSYSWNDVRYYRYQSLTPDVQNIRET